MGDNTNIINNLISFHLELAGRANADKTFSIYLRVNQNKKHKRVKTSVSIKNKPTLIRELSMGAGSERQSLIINYGMKY